MSNTPHTEFNPATGQANAQPGRRTFIEQATRDLQSFENFMRNEAWVYTTERQAVIRLLARRLQEARTKGYDDDLYTTYLAVKSFAEQHWYYKNAFLRQIDATLNAIQEDQLTRERSDNGRLSAQNIQLQEVNRRLQASEHLARLARDTQRQVAEEKSVMLQEKNATIMQFNQQHSELVAKLEEAHKRIDQWEAGSETEPRGPVTRKSRPSQGTAGYNPRLIGGSAARSEEKAYYRSSPKPPRSGMGYHTSSTSPPR